MRARRDAAIRVLKVMMVATVAIPVAIFSYASWVGYQNTFAHADEKLLANLGIMAEHTSRIFQSVDLTFTAIDAIAGDLTDEQIKANEAALHAQLSKLEKATAAVDAIVDHRRRRARAGVLGDFAGPRDGRRRRPRLFPGAEGARCRNLYRRGPASARAQGCGGFFRRQPQAAAAERQVRRGH